MKLHVEIRPGEGGEDAKMLVGEHAGMYCRFAEHRGINAAVEEDGSRL